MFESNVKGKDSKGRSYSSSKYRDIYVAWGRFTNRYYNSPANDPMAAEEDFFNFGMFCERILELKKACGVTSMKGISITLVGGVFAGEKEGLFLDTLMLVPSKLTNVFRVNNKHPQYPIGISREKNRDVFCSLYCLDGQVYRMTIRKKEGMSEEDVFRPLAKFFIDYKLKQFSQVKKELLSNESFIPDKRLMMALRDPEGTLSKLFTETFKLAQGA